MEENITIVEKEGSLRDGMVHFILSHSYMIFFAAIIFGAIFHTIFNFRIFSGPLYQYIGAGMIVLGSILIYWAQSSSGCVQKEKGEHRTEEDFERGPYKYSRNPTHIGLSMMTLGLGLILNSLFTIVFLIIASIITKSVFLKKEEKLLEEKYGQAYCDYKKKVGTWI